MNPLTETMENKREKPIPILKKTMRSMNDEGTGERKNEGARKKRTRKKREMRMWGEM